MAENSKISWTDHTWNPWQGCSKVSDGCKNCYMFRDKKRYGQDASTVVRSKPATFNKPLHWKDPAKVFVCSWSDFFIEEADEWRGRAFEIMQKTQHLTYLLLTKRPENISSRWPSCWRPDNVWIGTTVENQHQAHIRIPLLFHSRLAVKFISMEPMLGPVDISSYLATFNVSWIIVGAESGPDRRPCKVEWIRDIVRQCKEAGVPVFVKQMEINGKISADPDTWLEDLRIQEFPR